MGDNTRAGPISEEIAPMMVLQKTKLFQEGHS